MQVPNAVHVLVSGEDVTRVSPQGCEDRFPNPHPHTSPHVPDRVPACPQATTSVRVGTHMAVSLLTSVPTRHTATPATCTAPSAPPTHPYTCPGLPKTHAHKAPYSQPSHTPHTRSSWEGLSFLSHCRGPGDPAGELHVAQSCFLRALPLIPGSLAFSGVVLEGSTSLYS